MTELLAIPCCECAGEPPPPDCFYLALRCECSPAGAPVMVPCNVVETFGVLVFRTQNGICYEIDDSQTFPDSFGLEVVSDLGEPMETCEECCEIEGWCKYEVCECSAGSGNPTTVYFSGGACFPFAYFVYSSPPVQVNGCYEFVEIVDTLPPGAIDLNQYIFEIDNCDVCCHPCPPSCETCPDMMVVSAEFGGEMKQMGNTCWFEAGELQSAAIPIGRPGISDQCIWGFHCVDFAMTPFAGQLTCDFGPGGIQQIDVFIMYTPGLLCHEWPPFSGQFVWRLQIQVWHNAANSDPCSESWIPYASATYIRPASACPQGQYLLLEAGATGFPASVTLG